MSITIGSVTPAAPAFMTLVRPDKPNAKVQTYSGVAYFSWPATIVGKIIELRWAALSAADFAALDALYVADSEIVFNPDLGDNKTYNVEITGLDGIYLAAKTYRGDVKLQLLIMSVVS